MVISIDSHIDRVNTVMQGNQFYQYPSMRMGDLPNNHQHPSHRNVVEPPLLSYPSMRMGDLPNNHQHPSHRNVVEPPLLSLPPAPLSALTPYLPRNSRPVGFYTVALTDHPILPGPGPVEPSPGSGSHSGQADLGFYIQPAFNRQFIDPPIWWNAAQPFNSEQALADPPSSGQSFSFVKRLGTYRLPYDESHMSAPEMSKYLGMELEGRPPIEVHNLIERLYPDEVLPFPITSDILAHKAMETMWDNSAKVWKFGETYEEVQFSIILNNIAQALGQIFHLSRRRVWTARLRDCSPEFSGRFRSDPPCRLKPDLVLVPKDAVEDNSDDKTGAKTIVYRPINWDTIRAVAEITKSKVMPPRTKATINNKSFILLITQPERIFVPFLTIYSCNPQRIQFRVTDRQGQTTCDFVLNGQSEVTALLLLRIVAAFAFGDTRLHGRDPTIVQERTFGFQITAGSITYRFAKLIHSSQSMIGRCTRVWSAVDPATQNRVIIKDGWLHHKRASSEGFYLKRLQAAGVSSIPTVIWEGAVGTDREASTSTIRQGFFPDDDCRIHRRIVLTPHGEPLTNFISLAELITALRDVVCGMSTYWQLQCLLTTVYLYPAHCACIDNDVLHGDISLNNIVLVQQGGIYRKGYLIDFDYASLCSSNDGFGEHTVSRSFFCWLQC
jgi:Fungal protein kinase